MAKGPRRMVRRRVKGKGAEQQKSGRRALRGDDHGSVSGLRLDAKVVNVDLA